MNGLKFGNYIRQKNKSAKTTLGLFSDFNYLNINEYNEPDVVMFDDDDIGMLRDLPNVLLRHKN
jgi:hypothetical protein